MNISLSLSLRQPLLCLILSLFSNFAFAQNTEPPKSALYLRAHWDKLNNKILLRWAPQDYLAWKTCNEYGYTLERFTLVKEDVAIAPQDIADTKIVLAGELRPVADSIWEPFVAPNNQVDSLLAGVVAGSLYGDSLEVLDLANTDFMSVKNLNEERENRFAFSLFACDQDFTIATMAALALEDRDEHMASGDKYLYLIRISNLEFGEEHFEPGVAIIELREAISFPKPKIEEVQPGYYTAAIVWDKMDDYSSYQIERLTGSGWEVRNSRPFISMNMESEDSGSMVFADSLDGDKVYFYRIKGKTPFGIFGPVSDSVRVQGKPAILIHAPSITQITETTSNDMKIDWEMQAGETAKVQKYQIFRATEMEGNYQLLDSVGSNQLTFTDPNPLRVGYYLIKAKDLNGQLATSFPRLAQLNDLVAPAVPQNLSCSCDKNGVVKLHWQPNTEEDLWGYRVFTANQAAIDSEYIQITPAVLNDTSFLYQISLNTLSEQIFFKIKAIDFRENDSPFSATCTATRPDIIPPSAPVISAVRPRPEAVEFDFVPSSSPDVVKYVVQKRREESPNWTTLHEFQTQTPPTTVTDSLTYLVPATRRIWYQYRVLVYDEAGNVASSKPLRAKPAETGIRPPLRNFAGVFTPTTGAPGTGKVTLTWEVDKDVDLLGFQVFRAIDTSLIRPFEFVALADAVFSQNSTEYSCRFVDFDMDFINIPVRTSFNQPAVAWLSNTSATVQPAAVNQPKNLGQPGSHIFLHYRVMAVFADGAQSPLTGLVSVQIQ